MRGVAVSVMQVANTASSASRANSAQVLFMLMRVVRVFRLRWQRLRRNHVHLGCGQAPAAHPTHLQARAHAQRSRCFFKTTEGNARIHQGAQQHVAAYAGKTLKITNTHHFMILNRCL